MNVVLYYLKWCIAVDHINQVDIRSMRKLDTGYNYCRL